MFILNEHDVDTAVHRADFNYEHGEPMPVTANAARILRDLVAWTNENSDGWPYWKAPSQASAKLQRALYERFFAAYNDRVGRDMTIAELRKTLTPIKTLLTKHGVSPQQKEMIYGRHLAVAVAEVVAQ